MEKGEVAVVINEDNTVSRVRLPSTITLLYQSGEVPGPATSTSLDTIQFKHDFFEVSSQVLRRECKLMLLCEYL